MHISRFHARALHAIAALCVIAITLGILPMEAWKVILVPVARAEVTIDASINKAIYQFNASPTVVFTNTTTGYAFYVDSSTQDLVYSKTTDSGATWGNPVSIETTRTWTNLAVWYDQWTPGDTTGTKIYIHAAEEGTDDTWFTYLDTSSDTKRSIDVNVLIGTTIAPGSSGPPSITKNTDGSLFASANFSATPTGGLISKSTDGGETWSNITPSSWSSVNTDQIQIVPLKEGGDVLAIKADTTANTINSRVYDEGTDAWEDTWTSIATLIDNSTYEQWFNAMTRKSTGDIYLTFSNAPIVEGNDVVLWMFSDAQRSWSQKTNILTDSAIAFAPVVAIDDDLGEVFVSYLYGTSGTKMHMYFKKSQDGGQTWSSPMQLSTVPSNLRKSRMSTGGSDLFYATWYNQSSNGLYGVRVPTILRSPTVETTIDNSLLDATDEFNASPSVVFTDTNTGYVFYIDETSQDLAYRKTTNGGTSWGSPVVLNTAKDWTNVAVWYDRWTPGNRTGTGINIIASVDTSSAAGSWYISLDSTDDIAQSPILTTSSNVISETTTGPPSIVQGSGGALFVVTNFSNVAGSKIVKSTNRGIDWTDITPTSWGSTATEQIQLVPLKTSQDIMAIKVTGSAIQYRIYNESTDSWAGSWSTIGSLTMDSPTYMQPSSAAVRTGSGDIFLSFQNQVGSSTNDLELWHFKDATRSWTRKTNVVTNDALVVGATTLIDETTGVLYVAYMRGSPSAALWTAVNTVYRYSTDNGATWSAELTPLSTTEGGYRIIRGNMNNAHRLYAVWYDESNNDLFGATIALLGARFRQSAYRFFANANSLDVGSPLASQDTSATLTSIGQAFRLRIVLRDTDRDIVKGQDELKLQYARKGVGTCASPTGTYANVSDFSTIRWNDNASAKNGAAFTSNASDPTYSGTTRNQSYVEGGAFTNSGAAIASGENGMWDFSLKDNGGYGNTYCFRIVMRDGTILSTYDAYPEITTAGYQVISGSVYTDEGTTGMGAGRRVSISLNGGAATGSGLTRAGGFYRATLTGATLTGGTIISAYLDGATEKAVTVTLGSGSSMTGIHLYQNHLIVRSDSGATALTSAHLNIANNNGDSDITALYNTDASNNLQVVADKELYVWNGDTFAPGAKVRTHDLEVQGTLALSTYGLTLSGSLVANAGTLTTSTGITLLNATGETFNPGTNALKNLTLQSASSTLGSALDVNGTLTIGAGSSLDVSASNYGVTLSGSLINKAGTTGFVKRSGTVTLDGGDQTLSGSTIFHNLSKTVTTAKTLTLYKGYTTTVSGALTLQGTTNNLLSLRSSTNGTAARLVLDGDSGTSTLSYLNVKDSNATGGATLVCSNCNNAGNNTNWAFPFTVTAYDTDGNVGLGASKTVAVAVNGGTKTTAETDASSTATFSTVSVSAGDILTMWLDDETENGVTVTIGNGTTSLFSLRRNHVTLRDDNGTTVTNTILATAMGTSDDDLTAALGVSGGSLTVQDGFTLLVNGGDTFAPGGAVSVDDLSVAGTMTMGSSSLTVRGSMDNDGTFTTTGTATFTGASSETISMGGASFQHLVLNGAGGTWTMQDALSVGGNLTITAGTLALGSQSLTVGGTFANDGTLSLDGGNTLTGLTNDTNSGEIRLTGAGSYASLAGMTTFYDLSIAGTGTWALSNNTTVNGNFTQSSGTVKDGGKTLTVGGNVSLGSTFTATGTLLLTGTSKSLSLGGNALRNLTLQSASSTLGSALDVNGTLTIGAGSSLDVSASNYGVTLSGSLINKAGTTGFVKRSGTVTLDGGDQTLSGSTIFHNLSKTVTTAKTLTLYKGYTTTVSGALTLQGTTNNLLSLRSSTNGTAARLVLDGDNGTQSVSEVNVQDNNATGGATILCTGCTNGGNNTNWAFPIGGIAYSDEGVTPISAGTTIAVSVNGGSATTTTTAANGTFSMLGPAIGGGDVVAFYIDNAATKGATIILGTGGIMPSVAVYGSRLIIDHSTGGTVTTAHLATADNGGDTDLTALYTVTGNDLTVHSPYELFVWHGTTFRPGGLLAVDDIDIRGTLNVQTYATNIGGSFSNSGGTITASNTVTFDSSTAEIIRMSSSSFQHLVLSGVGGSWTMQDALNVGGNLTISAGTLTLGSQSLTVGGTFANDGTLSLDGGNTLTGLTNDTNSGEIRLTGAGSYASLAGMTTFYDLSIAGTGTWALSNNTTVNGNFTQSSGTVKDGGKTLTVGGNVSLGSTFTATGTLLLTGTSKSLSLGGNALRNLTLQSSSYTLGSALDVNGTLTIGAGSSLDVSASNYGVTLSGSLINKAGTTGFVKRSGTVTLDGGDQTLSGSTIFHNLSKTVTTAKTLTLYKGYTTTVSGALTLQGTTNNLLSLRSSTNGTAARLVLDGDNGTQSVSEVNVQDNNATGGATILCTGCTNGGNNTNWAFPISVTAYDTDGSAGLGANKTVAVAVNGGAKTTAETNASSVATFLTVSISAGDIVTVWLDDETEHAATITVSDGNNFSFSLVRNRLTLRSDNGSSLTNAHLITAASAGSSDSDIASIYGVSGGALMTGSGISLLVATSSTYAPGGAVHTHDLTVQGAMAMSGSALTLSGSLSNAGTFTSTGTVTLTSQRSETIALGGSSLMHMTVHGTGGIWTMHDALTMSGNLTIAAGTLMLGSHALTIEGTFSNNGTLQLNGDNVITGLTNDTNSGEVKFTGSGSYADTANIVRFYDLTIHGSGSWTLSEGIDVEHNFTQTQGAFRDAGYNMAVGGDFTATADFVGSGTVMLLGSGTVANAGRFGGLIIAATDYTRRMETDLHLSEGLTINSGTFDVSDNNYALTVGGDWNNNATFLSHSGTVVLNGSGQTIYGDTTFYHFTSTGSVTDTLTFEAGTTQTIAGTFRLQGASSATLSLRSTSEGSQWSINPRATRTIGYVNVKDSENANATTILCSDNCSNAGNNTNWSFPILVTAYGSDGTTGIGAGMTVALSVNGGAKMTAETSADSQAIFTGITTASGDILSIWLDDESDNAVSVVRTNGTSLSFSLVKDQLILRGDAGAITSAHLSTADDSSDDDILSAYTMSGTNLTVSSAFTLQIPSGKTFTLGGTMDVTNITIDGTLAMGENAVTARGEWNARSGSVTGSNAVTFTSDDAHTITPGSNAFYDLTFVIPDTGTLLWSSSGAITATYQQRIESDGEDADTIAPTISTATASTILDTSAIIRWTTNESAYGTIVYGTSTGALSSRVSSANLNLSHALTLTGLTAETLYYFRAVARDASGNTATGALLSFTTRDTLVTQSNAESSASAARSAGYEQGYNDGISTHSTNTTNNGGGGGKGRSSTNTCLVERSGAAFAIDSVSIDTKEEHAIMRWKTNGRALSIVQYGKTSIDELSAVSLGLSISHEVTLQHLQPKTWYVVRATSVDSCGTTIYKDATFQSGDFIPDDLHASASDTGSIAMSYQDAVDAAMRISADMASTLPAALLEEQLAKQNEQIRTLARSLPGPIQAGEPVVSVTADSATIRWSTDKPSNAVVLLTRNGVTEERGTFTIEGTDHVVTLRDLEPDTLYRYRVRNTTDIGTETVSKEFTFRTAERVGEISSIETTVLSPSSARFGWVSSVETTTGITWMPYREGTPQTDEARTVTSTALSSTHEQILSDLEAGVFYDIELWGKTPNGAKISTMIRAFTTSPEDLPPMIYDIAAHPTISPGKESKIQLTITWMTNESATTAVAYREGVVKDAADDMKVVQSDRGLGKAHTEILTNLEPGTVYSFRVESTDYGGSVAASNVFTILTPRQQKSVFQVITEEFEGAFGWLRNLRM